MSALCILMVEDDQDVCIPTTFALCQNGFQVHAANDGSEALRLIQAHQYDAALLDYKLPDTNGLELYARLEQVQPGVPCAFITAFATVDLIEAALDAGVRRVLPKPVDVAEVVAVVEDLAAHRV